MPGSHWDLKSYASVEGNHSDSYIEIFYPINLCIAIFFVAILCVINFLLDLKWGEVKYNNIAKTFHLFCISILLLTPGDYRDAQALIVRELHHISL